MNANALAAILRQHYGRWNNIHYVCKCGAGFSDAAQVSQWATHVAEIVTKADAERAPRH